MDTADLASRSSLAVRIGAAAAPEIVVAGQGGPIALSDARSVWWRRPGPFDVDHLSTAEERSYAELELRHSTLGFASSLGCYFVSDPIAMWRAQYKLGQLKRAYELGLAIPDTLLTSDPDLLREFSSRHQPHGVIFKSLADPLIPRSPTSSEDQGPRRVVYTTHLTEELVAGIDTLGQIPTLFQERVEKDVELRVTIIGDDVFVAEIKSQVHTRTSVDWRHHEVALDWGVGSLPDDVEAACVALTRGYGLNYGAVDLIRRPDGQHVFLEINPNGQWLFVERRVPALRMLEAMAACLVRGANS